jgi:hypothetical protein
VRFLSTSSPYISALGGLDLEQSLLSVDAEKNTCVFMQMFHDRLQVTTRAQFSDPTVSKPGPYPNPDLRYLTAYSYPRWRATRCLSFRAWPS